MKKSTVIVLLILIYISFISLGLPDGLLGVGWPIMRQDFNQSLQAAGLVILIMMPLSTLSSMNAARLKQRFGVGPVAFASALLTAISLLGIGLSASFEGLLLFSVGLGIGQGAVDALLNDVVAQNFASKHMSWLHGFWGVGATLGPGLMTFVLSLNRGWTLGYFLVGSIQLVIAFLLLLSLPLWKKLDRHENESKSSDKGSFNKTMLYGMAMFFIYVGVELGVGLWSNSVLFSTKGLPIEISGYFVSLYYLMITGGRFISGLISIKVGNRSMVNGGLMISFMGLLILSFFQNPWMLGLGISLTGLGFAPLYPSMMHETAARYNALDAAIAVGYQVGMAYIGGTLISSLLGVVLDSINLNALYPLISLGVLAMFFIHHTYNKRT
jgi:fucose permease